MSCSIVDTLAYPMIKNASCETSQKLRLFSEQLNVTGHKYMGSISVNKGTFYGHRFIDEFMDGNKAYFACENSFFLTSRKRSFYVCFIVVLRYSSNFLYNLIRDLKWNSISSGQPESN